MATLLLDGCTLLWALGAPEKLGMRARDLITDPDNRVMVSVGTLWELSIKVSVGKLTLPPRFFDELEGLGYEKLEITTAQLEEYRRLPLLHRDPFDRLLVAQSRSEAIPLVTCDPEIRKYEVDLVWD